MQARRQAQRQERGGGRLGKAPKSSLWGLVTRQKDQLKMLAFKIRHNMHAQINSNLLITT